MTFRDSASLDPSGTNSQQWGQCVALPTGRMSTREVLLVKPNTDVKPLWSVWASNAWLGSVARAPPPQHGHPSGGGWEYSVSGPALALHRQDLCFPVARGLCRPLQAGMELPWPSRQQLLLSACWKVLPWHGQPTFALVSPTSAPSLLFRSHPCVPPEKR